MSHGNIPIEEVPLEVKSLLPKQLKVDLSHEDIEIAMHDYFSRGGSITLLPSQQYEEKYLIPCNGMYEDYGVLSALYDENLTVVDEL